MTTSQHYREIYVRFFDHEPVQSQLHDYHIVVRRGRTKPFHWQFECYDRKDVPQSNLLKNLWRLGAVPRDEPFDILHTTASDELLKVVNNYPGVIRRICMGCKPTGQWELPLGRLLVHAAVARASPEWKRPVPEPYLDKIIQRIIINIDHFDPKEGRMVVLKHAVGVGPESTLYCAPPGTQNANVQYIKRTGRTRGKKHDKVDHAAGESPPQGSEDLNTPEYRPVPVHILCGAEKLAKFIACSLHEACITVEDAQAFILRTREEWRVKPVEQAP